MSCLQPRSLFLAAVFRALPATCLLAGPAAAFGVTMEEVEFLSLPDAAMEVRMIFDAAPPEPVGYMIRQPARLVLDLAGVASGLDARRHALDTGSMTVFQAGDRTRVVVAMSEPRAWSTRLAGNVLSLLLGADEPAAAYNTTVEADEPVAAHNTDGADEPVAAHNTDGADEPAAAHNTGEADEPVAAHNTDGADEPVAAHNTVEADGPVAAHNTGGADEPVAAHNTVGADEPVAAHNTGEARSLARVEDIDFRRAEAGAGRIIVSLSDAGAVAEVTEEAGGIRVRFADVTMPERLVRRLDVTDFATPVIAVDSLAEDGEAVMVVEPSGPYDYLSYQADRQFTLEVKPRAAANTASAEQAPRYRGEELSFNFQDIEIRSVLQLIADFTDLNLIVSDTVSGRITLRLRNVPWDQALDIILKARGLDKRLEGNVLMIASVDELHAREQLDLEAQRQLAALTPLKTEFIEVKYADAAEVFALFQGGEEGGEGVISSRGSVIVDARTNSIIITETAARIDELRALLDRLDVPVRQVLIEARIVTAASSFGESLGVRWGALGAGSYNDGTTLTQFGGSLTTLGEIRDTFQSGKRLQFDSDDNLIVDLGAAGNAARFALGVVDRNFLLELELSALETEGRGEVIARPKVITADKQQASIASGDQIPYQEASSSGATSTRFVDAVLGLTVTPRITPDDRIMMDLDVTQDSVGAVFNGIPSIRTNSIQTQVLVDDGETIVLGGVFQTTMTEGVSKTPLLGDIPGLGRLFKRTTRSDDKQELLIFITPRLIRDTPSR